MENTNYRSKFVVTFSEDINNVVSKRAVLKSLNENSDINIIKQYMACVKYKRWSKLCNVNLICDDTDVFVLLTVYVFPQGCKLKVLMEALGTTRSLIDINRTAKKHAKIVPSLIGAHELSGCDYVPKLYGIDKKTIINLISHRKLNTEHGTLQDHWQMFMLQEQNCFNYVLVSRMQITYLKYGSQFGENEPERS